MYAHKSYLREKFKIVERWLVGNYDIYNKYDDDDRVDPTLLSKSKDDVIYALKGIINELEKAD